MKPLHYIFSVFVCGSLSTAAAYDISSTVDLERYTITGDSVEYASGHLQKNGSFKVSLSYEVDPFFYDSVDDFALISGRPIMNETLFNAYKSAGFIPNWVRSQDSFAIGYIDYVIVSVKGGPDPNPLPTIIEQPQSQRAIEGDIVYFDVDAIPWNVSYQWTFKNKPIPGETKSWIKIANVTKANAGIYSVSISTGGKPILSQKALLQIVQKVGIKTQPKSQTVTAGKKASLRGVATGTGPFTYQWFFNGNAISNATKSFYALSSVKDMDVGNYLVVVRNEWSMAVSSAAAITIGP